MVTAVPAVDAGGWTTRERYGACAVETVDGTAHRVICHRHVITDAGAPEGENASRSRKQKSRRDTSGGELNCILPLDY